MGEESGCQREESGRNGGEVRLTKGGVRWTRGGVRGKVGGVWWTRGRTQADRGRSQTGIGEESGGKWEKSGGPGEESGGKWEESGFHAGAVRRRSPSKGMYSMNRTSTGFFSVSATKSSSSSSFRPRITTQFTCRGRHGTRLRGPLLAFFSSER